MTVRAANMANNFLSHLDFGLAFIHDLFELRI